MQMFVPAAAAFFALALVHTISASANPAADGLAGIWPSDPARYERARLNYDLDAVRRGEAAVPAVFASSLPAHLPDIRDTRTKKQTFIRLVLPLILESNARILAKREKLVELSKQAQIKGPDRIWLADLARDYEVDPTSPDMIRRLLVRVDIIPPSLAIAQSITESGWGTSRFAHRGRALYGQRTWSRGGGIVPKRRRSGETYEVRAFESLLESVESYMRNLNTHPAYASLRAARAGMRKSEKAPSGHVLARGLTRYAETGERYVEDLHAIMRANRLKDFDQTLIQIGYRVAAL